MRQDVENGSRVAGHAADPDTHIDVADLGCRRKCRHPVNIVRTHGGNRAEDDSAHTEDTENLPDRHPIQHVDSDHAPIYFYQQENIGLRYQRRKHRGRSRSRPAVGIRHPEMERKKTALDGKTDGQDSDRKREGCHLPAVFGNFSNRALHIHHKKMPGYIIKQHHAKKKQAGAQKVQDHIADGGKRRPADLAHDEEAAAGQRQDLQKNVACENIICPGHGHKRRRQQVEQRKIQVDLAFVDVLHKKMPPGKGGTQHDDQKS